MLVISAGIFISLVPGPDHHHHQCYMSRISISVFAAISLSLSLCLSIDMLFPNTRMHDNHKAEIYWFNSVILYRSYTIERFVFEKLNVSGGLVNMPGHFGIS